MRRRWSSPDPALAVAVSFALAHWRFTASSGVVAPWRLHFYPALRLSPKHR